MQPYTRTTWAVLAAIGGMVMAVPGPARGQAGMSGRGRSLGGYGASTITSYYGGGSGAYLPYNGRAGGYVPYRSNGGFSQAPPISRRLPQTPIGGVMMPTTPIGGASLSGGRGGAMGTRPTDRGLVPFGYEGGIGMGGGPIGRSMTRQAGSGMRRSNGPGFGSPFRMPPSLAGASSSMAMP